MAIALMTQGSVVVMVSSTALGRVLVCVTVKQQFQLFCLYRKFFSREIQHVSQVSFICIITTEVISWHFSYRWCQNQLIWVRCSYNRNSHLPHPLCSIRSWRTRDGLSWSPEITFDWTHLCIILYTWVGTLQEKKKRGNLIRWEIFFWHIFGIDILRDN